MMVKICGITNSDDAQVAVEAGADALGFVFYERSPRAVKPDVAAAIISQLPAHVLKVGVFVNAAPARVSAVVRECGLTIAQLHGDEKPADAPAGVRVWKAVRVGDALPRLEWSPEQAEAYLFDAQAGAEYGGTGRSFHWDLLCNVPCRAILAGGLDAANVAEAIRRAKPWGVDASSRLEASPGRKDAAKVRAFLKAVRPVTES